MSSLSRGVGGDSGLVGEDLGCRRRRGDTEHDTTVGAELLDGRGESCRLAGPGGADDEHDVGVTGHLRGGLSLSGVEHDPAALDCCRRAGCFVGEAAVGPADQPLLFVEDRLSGKRTLGRRLAHWPSVTAQQRTWRDRRRDVDTALDGDVSREVVDPADDKVGGLGGVGRGHRGEFADELGGPPRRLLLGDLVHRLADHPVLHRRFDRMRPAHLVERTGDDCVRFEAEDPDLFVPDAMQLDRVESVRLSRAAVGHRFALEAPALLSCRLTLERVEKAVQLVIDPPLHLAGAGRELDELDRHGGLRGEREGGLAVAGGTRLGLARAG